MKKYTFYSKYHNKEFTIVLNDENDIKYCPYCGRKSDAIRVEKN